MHPSHINILFRYRLKNACPRCDGKGFIVFVLKKRRWWLDKIRQEKCPLCEGTGKSTK